MKKKKDHPSTTLTAIQAEAHFRIAEIFNSPNLGGGLMPYELDGEEFVVLITKGPIGIGYYIQQFIDNDLRKAFAQKGE